MSDRCRKKTVPSKRGRWSRRVTFLLAAGIGVTLAACDRGEPSQAEVAPGAAAPGGATGSTRQDTAGALPAPASGGNIQAGDARIDGGLIRTGTSRFTMSATQNGEARELGVLTHEVTRVSRNGRDLLRMVMSMKSPAGDGVDTAHVDAKTLAPVSLRGHNEAGTIALDFDGVKVIGTRLDAGGQPQPVTQTTPVAAFDASVIDFIVSAMPLALGYSARLPVFMFEQGGLAWYDTRVIGDVMTAGEASHAVEVRMPVGIARYNIAKSDRRLLSTAITFAQNNMVLQMTRIED